MIFGHEVVALVAVREAVYGDASWHRCFSKYLLRIQIHSHTVVHSMEELEDLLGSLAEVVQVCNEAQLLQERFLELGQLPLLGDGAVSEIGVGHFQKERSSR